MRSAHTTGPWEVRANAIVSAGAGPMIATVPLSASPTIAEQASANAHLIAAAPDLLKELRYALESTGHVSDCTFAHGVCDCWRASAKAAIAKAVSE